MVEGLMAKAEAIIKLKTLHDRELWAMRLCAEILGTFKDPWWKWEEIGVEDE